MEPVPLTVSGAWWNTAGLIQFSNATYGLMSVQLTNTNGRTNADCLTLCVKVGGVMQASGSSLSIPTTASVAASALTATVINGSQVDSDFAVRLTDMNGLLLADNAGAKLGGACDAASSTPTICRGHLPGGISSGNITVTWAGVGATQFQLSTELQSYSHTLSLTACNGLCAFTNGLLLGAASPGAPLNFGRTVTGHTRSAVLNLVNNGGAAVNLGTLTIAAPFSFATPNSIPASLSMGPGTSWQTTVNFKPNARGVYSGAIQFSANPSAKVPLNGIAHLRIAVPLKGPSGKIVMIRN